MLVSRKKYLEFLLKQKDKDIVKIITGIRRSGKSTLLNDLYYNELLKMGVNKENIIKIRLDALDNKALRDAEKLYSEIKSRIVNNDKYYIFLDEIQLVDNFEDVVNSLKIDLSTDIYITGSNSKFLSSDINTKFRGRGIELHILPLSFSEYYGHYGGDKYELFNEYMLYGGMPYLLQEKDKLEKNRYLQMIADTVQIKDLIERYNIVNVSAFEAVVNLLCSSIGSYISSKKISDTLRSNGFKSLDHKTVANYLENLCDAYLFYKVDRYDIKGKAYLKTLQKYYVCDLGIRNAILGYRQVEPTHAIENIVYLELKRRGYLVDVGINSNKEVDFVAKNMRDTYYIQVSYSLMNEETMIREVSSFYGIDDGYRKIILTMDNDPYTLLERGYRKLNLIEFLLNEKALEEI